MEEYRAKINADAGDVGDEISKALEELESAQTALDNTKQESVSHFCTASLMLMTLKTITVINNFVTNIDVAISHINFTISQLIGRKRFCKYKMHFCSLAPSRPPLWQPRAL